MNKVNIKSGVKKTVIILLLVIVIAGSLFGMCKVISDNWDVISLKRSRPELIEAVLKVQQEESKEINQATQKAKDNSVKKILSPLVIDKE
jgi:hypothetical protein